MSRPRRVYHLLPTFEPGGVKPGLARLINALGPGAAVASPGGRSDAPALPIALCALAGVILTALTFFPGLMNDDAIIQLGEARRLAFSDWHPPLMGGVWAVLDRAMPGPIGMLLLHNLMFWTGLGIIVYLAEWSALRACCSILAVGLFPPIFSALGTIWKDVGMGAALLLAFALLLYAERRSSRAALTLGLLSLLYGFAMRHNAAAAALPLAVWAGIIGQRLFWRGHARLRRTSLVLGAVLFAALGATVLAANTLLTAGRSLYPAQQIMIHDLVAISIKSHRLWVPASLGTSRGPVTIENLACIYRPESAVAVFNGNLNRCESRFQKILDAREMSDLRAAWMTAVVMNPGAYLGHRFDVFRLEFAMHGGRVCYPLSVGINQNSLGLEFRPSALYGPSMQMLTFMAYRTPLYRGWVYLMAIVVSLSVLWALRRGEALPALALGTSGLLYGLGYLLVATTCDFRMHWWTVVASIVLLAMTPLWIRASRHHRVRS